MHCHQEVIKTYRPNYAERFSLSRIACEPSQAWRIDKGVHVQQRWPRFIWAVASATVLGWCCTLSGDELMRPGLASIFVCREKSCVLSGDSRAEPELPQASRERDVALVFNADLLGALGRHASRAGAHARPRWRRIL